MNKRISLFFCGDFCSKPSTTQIEVSKELQGIISSCDLKICNFEVPLKPDDVDPKPGRFYQHDDAPVFLEKLGFNVFSFANNHAFDYGVDGWHKTFNAFTYKPFGSGTYEDAYKVKVVEKDGIKIGFFALCYAARFGVFDNFTDRDTYACAWINDLKVNHDTMEAKRMVDYLIVLPHDGIEYIDIPMPETIARYRDFIDYGADVVIGTHPHCPQGWEVYKDKPIFYSLGNFLFNSKDDYSYRATNRPHWYEGLCVLLTIDNNEISYEVINTLNEGNIRLSVNHSETRRQENLELCQYLYDRRKYVEKLQEECTRLTMSQELPIIDNTFHEYNLMNTVKHLVKYTLLKFFKRPLPNDLSLRYLLKNNTRRDLLLHGLNNL